MATLGQEIFMGFVTIWTPPIVMPLSYESITFKAMNDMVFIYLTIERRESILVLLKEQTKSWYIQVLVEIQTPFWLQNSI